MEETDVTKMSRSRKARVNEVRPKPLLPLITDLTFVLIAAYLLLNYVRSLLLYAEEPLLVIRQAFFMAYLLIALILLAARDRAISFTPKPVDYVYTLLGLGSPLLFQPTPSGRPLIVGPLFEFAGLVLVVGAFLSLNRSFGLAPENRGIKTAGVYRFVRHPMYLGYILTETGFVLDNSSLFNLLIFGISVLFLLLRLRAEEQLLQQDHAYRTYARRTRWKLVPFMF
jgi:protein-S-isoprenylcysteine O-methyltransferase Ste14